MKQFSITVIIIMLLSGCTTFTTQNIKQLHNGMSPVEVRKIFGEPDRISSRECGTETVGFWDCEMWTYTNEFNDTDNVLIFSVEDGGVKKLNSWDV